MRKFAAVLFLLGLTFSGMSSSSALGIGSETVAVSSGALENGGETGLAFSSTLRGGNESEVGKTVADTGMGGSTVKPDEGFMFVGGKDKKIKNEGENKQKDEKKEEKKELSLPRRMLRYARKAAQAEVVAGGLIFANEKLDLTRKSRELLEDKYGLDWLTANNVAGFGSVAVCGVLMAAAAAI